MDKELLNLFKGHKKHYSEEKYELFFDYNNSYSFENMIKEINNNRTYQLKTEEIKNKRTYQLKTENINKINHNCYNNYSTHDYNNNSFNKSYNEFQSTKINSSFNSSSLNEYIQKKKEAFIKISNSMNNIINKHCNNMENNLEKNTDKNINKFNKDKNLNQIVKHLIEAYSKDELKFIKDKISNIVDEEEEPQPEHLFIYPNQNINNKINLKLSPNSPSFLKINNNNKNMKAFNNHSNKNIENNKREFFTKINKNINYKPIKITTKNISNKKKSKNDTHKTNKSFLLNKTDVFKRNNNNVKFKPEFYTYIKCKTSFECIDNFLKRQKTYNNYITNKNLNLKNNKNIIDNKIHTFIPNTTITSNSNYSIKLQAKRFNESKNDKAKRMLYNTLKIRKEKKDNIILKHNKSFSFNPNINKYKYKNKDLTIKKTLTKKSIKNNKNENNNNKELTPVKYKNHQYDYVKSIYRNDNELLKRIKEQSEKKIKKYEKLKNEYENEKLEGCTFKPDISKTHNKSLNYVTKYNKDRNNKNNIGNNSYNEKDNKNFTYMDFYQFKKNNRNKDDKKNKIKDIDRIGSLTPIIISKQLTKNNSSKKLNNNKNKLIMHKLLLDNNPDD